MNPGDECDLKIHWFGPVTKRCRVICWEYPGRYATYWGGEWHTDDRPCALISAPVGWILVRHCHIGAPGAFD